MASKMILLYFDPEQNVKNQAAIYMLKDRPYLVHALKARFDLQDSGDLGPNSKLIAIIERQGPHDLPMHKWNKTTFVKARIHSDMAIDISKADPDQIKMSREDMLEMINYMTNPYYLTMKTILPIHS